MDKGKPIVIKRYANRKLYNTNDSCYITLNEIAQMVKSGTDVKIIDYKTKKDITSVTLAQIIFEKEKTQKNLSSQTLYGIIQSGGEVITDFFQKRVNINQIREEAEKTVEVFEKLLAKSVFTRDDGTRLVRELLRISQHNLEDLQRRIDDRIRAVVGPVSNLSLFTKEMDVLRAQVSLLDEKVSTLEKFMESGTDDASDTEPTAFDDDQSEG